MQQIVVAKPDGATRAIAAVFALVVGGLLAAMGTGVFRWIVVAVAVFAVHRVSQMKVVVTRDAVRVVNLTGHTTLSHHGLRIVDAPARSRGLSDAGERMDSSGRALFLMDNTGARVRVGVAPMFGTRLDRVADEIYRAVLAVRPAR